MIESRLQISSPWATTRSDKIWQDFIKLIGIVSIQSDQLQMSTPERTHKPNKLSLFLFGILHLFAESDHPKRTNSNRLILIRIKQIQLAINALEAHFEDTNVKSNQ